MRSVDFYNIEEYIDQSEYMQFTILNTIKKESNYLQIYKDIIPKLINLISPNVIYNAIYNISELRNEIYLVLNQKNFNFKQLTNSHIKELLKTKTTTYFLYYNMPKLVSNIDTRQIIEKLETEDNEVIKSVLRSLSSEDRIWTLNLLHKNPFTIDELFFPNELQISFFDHKKNNINEEELVAMIEFLISTKHSLNEVINVIDKLITIYPNLNLGFILHQYFNNPVFEEYIKTNIDKIIPNCKEYSIKLIELTEDRKMLKKYSELLKLSKMANSKNKAIEHLVAQDKQDLIKELIFKYLSISKSKELRFLGSGQTTTAFKVGDYSLKVSSSKYTKTCPNNFRIMKTIEHIKLKDEVEIEIQKYLPPKEISNEDIYELLLDLDKSGLEVTDPHVLKLQVDNFGFLEDLADCDIDDINKLPAHFIEKPLVIYDKDLIYKKKDKNKKYFNSSCIKMDDLIDGYKSFHKKKAN